MMNGPAILQESQRESFWLMVFLSILKEQSGVKWF